MLYCDMTNEIEPALTPEEWAKHSGGTAAVWMSAKLPRSDSEDAEIRLDFAERPIAVIALANAALPDDDPRKITREKLDAMREVFDSWISYQSDIAASMDAAVSSHPAVQDVEELLAALAALLPPE